MFSGLTHHFYIVEGDIDSNHQELLDFLASQEIVIAGNPDVYSIEHESIGVDESRSLKDFFAMKTFGEGKRIAIVKTPAITREAQNALLKLTEEPAENSHIFFLIPHRGMIINTLLSRAEIISKRSEAEMELGKKFYKLSTAERMNFVQKIITKKDKAQAIELINSLIAYARHENLISACKDLYMVRGYIEDKSSSLKLLLEHLSLILERK